MTARTNTFSFAGLELRSITIEGKHWFLAADVFRAIGLAPGSTTAALQSLNASEVMPLPPGTFRGKGMSQAKLIAESGLYTIVMRAQKTNPKVAEFQTWVTGTVLPAIRQTGGYIKGEEKLATGEMEDEQRDAVSVWRVGLPEAVSVFRLPD